MKMSIDVKHSVLLVLHCQNDIVDLSGKFAYSGAPLQVVKHGILEKVCDVVSAARKAGVLVIYVNNAFRPGYPELSKHTFSLLAGARKAGSVLLGSWGVDNPRVIEPIEGDLVLYNYNTSAFSYTNLDQILRAQNINQLFLTGVATNFVVDSTARYGSELGYYILVIEDCCTSFTEEMHNFAINHILPHFGTIIKSIDFITNFLPESKYS